MTGTTTPTPHPDIEVHMFDTPSGNVRGMVTAFLSSKKGRTSIANATLLTDKATTISVKLPKSMSVADYKAAIPVMQAFADTVQDLDTQG